MRAICQRKLLICATLSLLFVFMFGSTTFATTKLLAPDGDDHNYFGGSVSIDGDVAVVGAPRDPYDPDPDPFYTGSAYVFRWNSTTSQWDSVQELLPSSEPLAAGDSFGFSVSKDGDVILVGAPNDDDRGTNSGSV